VFSDETVRVFVVVSYGTDGTGIERREVGILCIIFIKYTVVVVIPVNNNIYSWLI